MTDENTVLTIEDEDGNEYEIEHLDSFDLNGKSYSVFATAESADTDEIEVVIFRVTDGEGDEEGEEILEAIEDEAELEAVFAEFQRRDEQDECDCDDCEEE